jgi:hypothetical protein
MEQSTEINPAGFGVLKLSIFLSGGIKTPQDFHPTASSNEAPFNAAAVRRAWKSLG